MFYGKNSFDIIVVGGGHAGVEAAYASAKMGRNVLLLTYDVGNLGETSCNPAIGGIGKSNLVKEIDALGGLMGRLSDLSGIQYRVLNSSRGYAVRATRIQIDRKIYKQKTLSILLNIKNICVYSCEVTELIIKNNTVLGVIVNNNDKIFSSITILATGTFLDAKIYISKFYSYGGRINDFCSRNLACFLKHLCPDYGYLKTGTPPRIDSTTVNTKKLFTQESAFLKSGFFSVFRDLYNYNFLPQVKCYLTNTNSVTHKIILDNIHKSALFNDLLKSVGPRYCLSLEDKILKFSSKLEHQIFLELESLSNTVIYPNGLSMSLPIEIQKNVIHSICGMEKAKIICPGYAIKYLFFNPNNLYRTLESKKINNLFFAGQINGTTGYEEAAAQGLVAGINASLKFNFKGKIFNHLKFKRNNSYIGVLIDDLCHKSIEEPYRIFTSRAEYRLFLREDNADYRLTPLGYKLGLISEKKWIFFNKKMDYIKCAYNYFKNKKISKKKIFFLKNIRNKEISIKKLISDYFIEIEKIKFYFKLNKKIESNPYLKEVEILIKYENYLKKQKKEIKKFDIYKNIKIPKNINFSKISGLSKEVIENLNKYKPSCLRQLYKITGITPAAIIIILIFLQKFK